MRWLLHEYKYLWDMGGKGRDSSFQERVSHTYILRLGYNRNSIVWANFALCSNCVGGSQAQYYPHSYKWSKEGPDPIPRAKANEGPRTTIPGMDKITIRGELKHAGEELGHVRGRWSPRDFCPRYLVNLLITQNNAWDKSYNRAKGEISNKK